MLAERPPQARGLDQQLKADLFLELGVLGGVQVADDGVGDVGVDVERGGPRRPVARALLAADRPPRERGPGQAEIGRALLGQRQHQVPPAQGVARGGRLGVGEHGQHEGLGIPERVPVVAVPGQPLRRDRPVLRSRTGLQDVEQPEAHRLLDLGVAVHLDVGTVPELVKVGALLGQQPGR